MGIWGAVAAAGGAVGVVLGGVLIQLLSWSWVLFVNVPIGVVAILVALKAIRSEPPLERAHFDIVGALTLTGGLVAIVFAIVSSRSWGLASPDTLGVLALGVVLLLAFWVQEARFAAHPLVPLRIFASRHLTAANVVMFFIGCAMYSAFFFVTLYLQEVRGYSPLAAGIAFLPLSLGIMAGSTAATRLTGWLGPLAALVGGLTLAALGMLLFTRLAVTGSFASQVLIPSLTLGVGMGIAFVPATIAAVGGVPKDLAGLAAGLANMSRSVGGSLGLAALATVAASRTDQILAQARDLASPEPHRAHKRLYARVRDRGGSVAGRARSPRCSRCRGERRRHERSGLLVRAIRHSGRHLRRPAATRSSTQLTGIASRAGSSGASRSAVMKYRASMWKWAGSCPRGGIGCTSRSKISSLSSRSDTIPVSSRASLSATRGRSSFPSAWPPGWSHRCSFGCSRSKTTSWRGSTIQAEAVQWYG